MEETHHVFQRVKGRKTPWTVLEQMTASPLEQHWAVTPPGQCMNWWHQPQLLVALQIWHRSCISELPVSSYGPTPTTGLLHPGDGSLALLQVFTKESPLSTIPIYIIPGTEEKKKLAGSSSPEVIRWYDLCPRNTSLSSLTQTGGLHRLASA